MVWTIIFVRKNNPLTLTRVDVSMANVWIEWFAVQLSPWCLSIW